MAADQKSQNFSNHTRFDPLFHFFLLPIALASVIIAIVHAYKVPTGLNGWLIVIAIAAFVAVGKTRGYALKVQDRIIRLEERIRLASVLQEPLRSRISELSEAQLIGLRFASDGELPALAQRALSENLIRTDIKKAVTNWRADAARV
jgi:hypothetical protein